jgi:hypothetical protein
VTELGPRYRPHPDVVSTPVGESETVLLDLTAGRYYTVNGTGGRLWQALLDGADAPGLAGVLEAEYEVGRDEALGCARDFLRELVRERLVREEPPQA